VPEKNKATETHSRQINMGFCPPSAVLLADRPAHPARSSEVRIICIETDAYDPRLGQYRGAPREGVRVPSADDLGRILNRIDGRGYKAYREIRGEFELGSGSLFIDHVQGDPYAAPSKLR
jgi:hypothetical protein